MTEYMARIVLDTEDWDTDIFGGPDRPVMWHRMPTSFAVPFAAHEVRPNGLVGDQYFD